MDVIWRFQLKNGWIYGCFTSIVNRISRASFCFTRHIDFSLGNLAEIKRQGEIIIGVIVTDLKVKDNIVVIRNKKLKKNYTIIVKTRLDSSKRFESTLKEIIKGKMPK